MNGNKHSATIWTRQFLNLCIVNAIMTFGQMMMNTLISKLADHLGATAVMVGVVTSCFSITTLAVKPVSGTIIDTFDKKKVLFFADFAIMLAFVIYGLSGNIPTVFVGRLIHGLGMGFTTSTCMAMAADSLPDEKLTQGITYYTLIQAIVSAVAPSLGLSMLDHLGYMWTFFIGAVFMAVSCVLILFLDMGPAPEKKKFRLSLRNMFANEVIIYSVLLFFISMASVATQSFLVLYAQKDRGIADIGIYYTVNAIGMIISKPPIGKLAEKYGIQNVLIPAFLIYAGSMYLISAAATLPMFLVAAVLGAIGNGATQPLIQALCMKAVSKERRGIASTTSYIGTNIGHLAGAPLAGLLVEKVGYSSMFKYCMLPIFAAALLIAGCYRRVKADNDGETAARAAG